MSFGNRFKPARGLLTGVALENNDELAAGEPGEETPPVVEPEVQVDAAPAVDADAAPAGDAVDTPAATPEVAVDVDGDGTADAAGAVVPEVAGDAPAAEPVVDADAAGVDLDADGAADASGVPIDAAPVVAADDTDGPIQEDPLEELATADTQIGEDDAALDESMTETATATNEISEGTDNVAELDAIADALEDTMDEGGAPASTIAVANIAVEHAIARMNGGFKPKRLLPALESFGGIRNKSTSTQLAIESLRGAASTAGEKIMQFVHKCIAFLKNLLTKFMDGFGAMKKKLQALMQAAKQSKLAQGSVKIASSVGARLKLGGKFSKQVFMKGLKSLQGFIAKIAAMMGVSAKTVKGVDLLTGPATDGAEGNMFPPLDLGPLGAALKAFGGKTTEAEEGTVSVMYMEALPGDASAYVTGPDITVVGDTAYRAASSIDVNISNVSTEDEFAEVDETITEAEFSQMCKAMEQAISAAENMRNSTAQVIDAEASVVKVVGVASKKDQAVATGRKWLAGIQNFASRVATSLTRTVSKTISYVRGVLTAGLQYLASFVSGGKPADAGEQKLLAA